MPRPRMTLALGALAGGALLVAGLTGRASRASSSFKKLELLAGAPGGPGHRDDRRTEARFASPVALAFDHAGHLFVADRDETIREIELASGRVTTLAGAPGQPGSSDGKGAAARFDEPSGLACDRAGNVYVADAGNDTIRKIVVATRAVTTLAGVAGVAGHDDGSGSRARFDGPAGLACDGAGRLYVADSGNNAVRRVDLATHAVTTLAGAPAAPPEGSSDRLAMFLEAALTDYGTKPGGRGRADGRGAAARFRAPAGLVFDRAGVLYVADTGNDTIRKIVVATAEVTTLAGAPGHGLTVDGVGAGASFEGPIALALDHTGGLVVAQRDDAAVRAVDLASGTVTTFADSAKLLGKPSGLAVDDVGDLYIADAQSGTVERVVLGNEAAPRLTEALQPLWHGDLREQWRRLHHIRLHPPLGELTTFAGAAVEKGHVDKSGADARFDAPGALAFDGTDALYVVDRGNKEVRKVSVGTRAVTSVAGTAGYAAGPEAIAFDRRGRLLLTDSGDRVVLTVNLARDEATTLIGGEWVPSDEANPAGIAVDDAGFLFVADEHDGGLRRISLTSGASTPVAGWPFVYPSPVAGPSPGAPPELRRSGRAGGLALDGAGDLFVADELNGTVDELVLATGQATTLAGSPELFGHVDGLGAAARFEAPNALAYDGAGGLFVGDGETVRRVDVATGKVSTVVGVAGQRGVALGALPAGLNHVGGLAVGPGHVLFVSDDVENVVLEVR